MQGKVREAGVGGADDAPHQSPGNQEAQGQPRDHVVGKHEGLVVDGITNGKGHHKERGKKPVKHPGGQIINTFSFHSWLLS